MLHPSYTDLMQVVNSEVEQGEELVVNSRYSIVLATAKRARQIIDGSKPMGNYTSVKPLSIAVDELYKGKVKIVTEEEYEELIVKHEELKMNHNEELIGINNESTDIQYKEPIEENKEELND